MEMRSWSGRIERELGKVIRETLSKFLAFSVHFLLTIYIEGVPYPFFVEEFPHHVKAYNEQFPKTD